MIRFRNIILVVGSLITLIALLVSDPTQGAMTATTLITLATGFIAVGFAHLVRKALFDYVDMKELFEKAKKSSIGAGIAFAGICIVIFGLLGLFGNQARAEVKAPMVSQSSVYTVVPDAARTHLPTLVSVKKDVWDDHPNQQT
jgi:Na+/proline symporter